MEYVKSYERGDVEIGFIGETPDEDWERRFTPEEIYDILRQEVER